MASILNAPYFQDETAAYAKLESIVWPNGPVCPHCGCVDRMKLMGGKATRPGLYKCYACRKQSRVTVGTKFESSHIPLHQWLQAAYLLCSSKKGISSNQLARTLGFTVKSAWSMSNRLREAMRSNDFSPPGGAGEVVEADETFIGRKEGTEVKPGYHHKRAVLSLVEREGRVRSFHVDSATVANVVPLVRENIDGESALMTDESRLYRRVGKEFASHGSVEHGASEYGRGEVHAKTIEGFFSIFKHGFKGIYRHCGENHLRLYLAEYDFRYNNRLRFGIDDMMRTDIALKGIVGRRLTYRDSSPGQ